MNRVLSVVRLQLVAWPHVVGWPWGILGLAFVVNVALFTAIGDAEPQPTTGALMSIYIVMFVACIQGITQDFPFAAGLGVTRRTFYLANGLLLATQSFGYGLALYLVSLVERATGGWGIGLRFFRLPFLTQDNPVLQVLIYAVPFLLLGFLGTFIAVAFKRWGPNGLFSLTALSIVVFGGLSVWLTWQRHWAVIGEWLGDQSPASLLAGWPLLLTLPLAAAGYLTLRRTTV